MSEWDEGDGEKRERECGESLPSLLHRTLVEKEHTDEMGRVEGEK